MVRRWKGERERQRQTETEKQRDRKREIETEKQREKISWSLPSLPPSSATQLLVDQTQPKARGQLVGIVHTAQTLATSSPNPHTAIKPSHKRV